MVGERIYGVSVRMSKSELSDLDRRRGKILRGTFLRNIFLGEKEPRQIPEANREMYNETARWASNLNQIAKKLNSADVIEKEKIEKIQQTLDEFRKSIIGLEDDTKKRMIQNRISEDVIEIEKIEKLQQVLNEFRKSIIGLEDDTNTKKRMIQNRTLD